MGNWAFSWVQIIAHNKRSLAIRFGVILAVLLYGLLDFAWHSLTPILLPLLIATVLMSLVLAWLADSKRTALIQFALSWLILISSFGVLGWLDIVLDETGLLALLVIVIMLSSNLIHQLSTLLREMARGLYQFDAVAEALKLNFTPIVLSNLTTSLGFIFAAWFNGDYAQMAWVVTIGAILSVFFSITLLPLILLSYFLEFRVGNTNDRNGFRGWIETLKTKGKWRTPLLVVSLLTSIVLAWYYQAVLLNYQFGLMLLLFAGLFMLYWRSARVVLFALWLTMLAWLISMAIQELLLPMLTGATGFNMPEQLLPVLLMLSLGLIIDDVVHFFSRYQRAQLTMFAQGFDAVAFAMASVARPIWISSWLLLIGMAVLLFSHHVLVVMGAFLTIISIIFITFMVLFWLPLLLTKGH
jgi:predicted RND superfamily exporter protein